jgi:hypothetical protein
MALSRPALLVALLAGLGCDGRPPIPADELSADVDDVDPSSPVDRQAACTGERYVRFPSFLQFEPNKYSAWRDGRGKIKVRVSRVEETPDGSSWTGVDVIMSSPRARLDPVPPLMIDLARLPPEWELKVGRYGGSSSVGSAWGPLSTSRDQARGFLRLTPEPDPELSLCLSIPVAQWSGESPSTLEIWIDRIALDVS